MSPEHANLADRVFVAVEETLRSLGKPLTEYDYGVLAETIIAASAGEVPAPPIAPPTPEGISDDALSAMRSRLDGAERADLPADLLRALIARLDAAESNQRNAP